jgi:hypothetical protein
MGQSLKGVAFKSYTQTSFRLMSIYILFFNPKGFTTEIPILT